LAKDVHFFDNKPFIMNEEGGFGGGSTPTQFVGRNRSTSAKIIYYLKKRHTFGKMTMEIQDMEGNKVLDITPGKTKGINVVTWNFVIKQPKMAKGKTFVFGGFTSPRVPAGNYQVVMTKGKNTYTQNLVLQYDPTSLLTAAERKEKHEITMKLYDMSQELAYFVYEIDENISKAEEISKDNQSAAKVAQPVITELNNLKETLVITTGDNYVSSAEPQLREKLGDIYSKVASSYDKVSITEKQNMKLIEDRFNKAKEDYGVIKKKRIGKMNIFIEKNGLKAVELLSYEDFLKKS
jgi:hypothetical protein